MINIINGKVNIILLDNERTQIVKIIKKHISELKAIPDEVLKAKIPSFIEVDLTELTKLASFK